MKRKLFLLLILSVALPAWAGFKVKLVKAKKPEQFQTRTTAGGVTFGADLLLEGKDQKDFFYKELTPSNVIAVRLAVFNQGNGEVVLPVDTLQLIGPDGQPLAQIAPQMVAQAVLQGLVVATKEKEKKPVAVSPSARSGDPRYDRSDPRYDPRLDPSDPNYDPNDPRTRSSRNPGGQYPGSGPGMIPGIDVVLNPGGGTGGGGDLTQYEKKLVEKDFDDKAHSPSPIVSSLNRDKFLYFSIQGKPVGPAGFTLRLPPSKGIAQEVVLKF